MKTFLQGGTSHGYLQKFKMFKITERVLKKRTLDRQITVVVFSEEKNTNKTSCFIDNSRPLINWFIYKQMFVLRYIASFRRDV